MSLYLTLKVQFKSSLLSSLPLSLLFYLWCTGTLLWIPSTTRSQSTSASHSLYRNWLKDMKQSVWIEDAVEVEIIPPVMLRRSLTPIQSLVQERNCITKLNPLRTGFNRTNDLVDTVNMIYMKMMLVFQNWNIWEDLHQNEAHQKRPSLHSKITSLILLSKYFLV